MRSRPRNIVKDTFQGLPRRGQPRPLRRQPPPGDVKLRKRRRRRNHHAFQVRAEVTLVQILKEWTWTQMMTHYLKKKYPAIINKGLYFMAFGDV